jgi:dienelactone hydrolase
VDEIPNGGADYGEIMRTIRIVRTGDEESWFSAWCTLADSVERLGILAERRGERTTAVQSYFRASSYYRVANSILSRDDPRDGRTYEKQVALFKRAAPYSEPRLETIAVSFDESELHGYLVRPSNPWESLPDERFPCCLIFGDVDSSCEEMYFAYGADAARRGIAAIMVDPPGQGRSRRSQRMIARYDFERVVGDAIDYISSSRNSALDKNRIALIGSGMGAYYAARAAAKEKRVKALAVFGAVYNAIADHYDFYPPVRKWLVWSTGALDSAKARAKLGDYNLEGVASQIECPVLINQGMYDVVTSPVAASRLNEAIKHKNKILRSYKAGHGISAFRAEAVSSTFDWLKRKMNQSSDA